METAMDKNFESSGIYPHRAQSTYSTYISTWQQTVQVNSPPSLNVLKRLKITADNSVDKSSMELLLCSRNPPATTYLTPAAVDMDKPLKEENLSRTHNIFMACTSLINNPAITIITF